MAKISDSDSTEDNSKFSRLNYTTLASIVQQGPDTLRQVIAQAGHPRIGGEITTNEGADRILQNREIQAQAKKKKEVSNEPKRGEIFYHKKRGTKVTIIQASVDVSEINREPIHLVSESKTGKKFRALSSNLSRL